MNRIEGIWLAFKKSEVGLWFNLSYGDMFKHLRKFLLVIVQMLRHIRT